MIDKDLINKFRDKVNENGFVLFKYRENCNRNQWNCICSAMDWISVASAYILNDTNGHGESIKAFAYISSINIIVEAIQQLHRVFFSTSKALYENDCEIFLDNQFNQTDIVYFKTLRACFGAHSVNLDDPNDLNSGKKRFASWSGYDYGLGKGGFSVILYSNQIDEQDIYLNIDFKQLNAFLEKYYVYLNNLITEIDRQYTEFCSQMREAKLQCEGDTLTQLRILQQANSYRLNNDYYRCTLDELILFFETPVTCVDNKLLVYQYLGALKELVEEIKNNLDKMVFCDLEHDDLLYSHPEGLQNGWLYWLEKISNYIHGSGYPPTMWLSKIEDIFKDKFVFSYADYNELYLLVHAALYQQLLSTKVK